MATTVKDTDTYVRSSETEKDKNKNTGKNTTDKDTDKTHDTDSYSAYRSSGTTGVSGTASTTTQYGQRSGQNTNQDKDDSPSNRQSNLNQHEVQCKLKEVGQLLQRAGQLLQDLQVSSGGECQQHGQQQSSSYRSFGGGNYQGPYGGFESQPHSHGPSCQHGQEHQYGQQYGQTQRFGQQPFGFGQEKEYFPRGGRFEGQSPERFGRSDRHEVDRFGGFGGPNRPDMAYGGHFEQRREQPFGGQRTERW